MAYYYMTSKEPISAATLYNNCQRAGYPCLDFSWCFWHSRIGLSESVQGASMIGTGVASSRSQLAAWNVHQAMSLLAILSRAAFFCPWQFHRTMDRSALLRNRVATWWVNISISSGGKAPAAPVARIRHKWSLHVTNSLQVQLASGSSLPYVISSLTVQYTYGRNRIIFFSSSK